MGCSGAANAMQAQNCLRCPLARCTGSLHLREQQTGISPCTPAAAGSVRSPSVWPVFMLLTCLSATCPETAVRLLVSTQVANSRAAGTTTCRSPRYRLRRPADWPVLVRSGHRLSRIHKKRQVSGDSTSSPRASGPPNLVTYHYDTLDDTIRNLMSKAQSNATQGGPRWLPELPPPPPRGTPAGIPAAGSPRPRRPARAAPRNTAKGAGTPRSRPDASAAAWPPLKPAPPPARPTPAAP
jgi:hypothetical protein